MFIYNVINYCLNLFECEDHLVKEFVDFSNKLLDIYTNDKYWVRVKGHQYTYPGIVEFELQSGSKGMFSDQSEHLLDFTTIK